MGEVSRLRTHAPLLARAALVGGVALAAARAEAGPPLDLPAPVALSGKTSPTVVTTACREAPVPSVTARALLDEIARIKLRVDALRQAEAAVEKLRAEIDEERKVLAAQQESLDAEQIDLELAREELLEVMSPLSAPGDVSGRPGRSELTKLSAVVKAMKPDKAAPLVSELDPELAAEVLRTLSRPVAAAILERIPADKAADLMGRLAAPPPGDGT